MVLQISPIDFRSYAQFSEDYTGNADSPAILVDKYGNYA
jgi:hypothetical protein